MPNAVENSESRSGPQALWIVGAPLLLAVVEIFHPHPHNLLELDVDTWLTVHYLQLPLFALSAMAVAALVRGRADIGARVCRGAMFVFGVSFIAFDTAAGIVTGILVNAAHRSQVPALYRVPIDVRLETPHCGGLIGSAIATGDSRLDRAVGGLCRRCFLSEARRANVAAGCAAGALELWHLRIQNARLAGRTADLRRNCDRCGMAAVGASDGHPCLLESSSDG